MHSISNIVRTGIDTPQGLILVPNGQRLCIAHQYARGATADLSAYQDDAVQFGYDGVQSILTNEFQNLTDPIFLYPLHVTSVVPVGIPGQLWTVQFNITPVEGTVIIDTFYYLREL